jgi:hypothetical protein
METFLHTVWNDIVEATGLPDQFSVKMIEEYQMPGMIHRGEFMGSMTTQNDMKVFFGWAPQGPIQINKKITFNIMFHQTTSNDMIKDITYDFELYQNGKLIKSWPHSYTESGDALHDFTFNERGLVLAKIKNINGKDSESDFSFQLEKELVGEMVTMKHGEPRFPLELIPVFLTVLIASPLVWYVVKNKKMEVNV